MKLPFINDGIFKPHKSLVERGESSYIYIYIYAKQELMGKNDYIDYNNLTYGDILSTIKKLGINMCNDEKLLKYQLKK